MSWLLLSNVALLAVVTGLGLVILSLARQIGILHERTAPLGIDRRSAGLEEGSEVPDLQMPTLAGGRVALRAASAAGRWTALLFVSADCPICKAVLPAYLDQLHEHRADTAGFWVGDGMHMAAYPAYVRAHGMDDEHFLISQELALHLQIRQLPSLVLIDDRARLVVNRVVSGPRQLHAVFRQVAVGEPQTPAQTPIT